MALRAAVVLGLSVTMGCAGARVLRRDAEPVPVGRVDGVAPRLLVEEDAGGEPSEDELPADAVRLCAEGPALEQARGALRRLDRMIEALDDAADPKSVEAELDRTMESPCFALAKVDQGGEVLAFDSGLSLKTWWSEGGSMALRAYTELHHRGIAVPGSPRRALLREGHAGHPLQPLLCSAKDPACGADTAGWAHRMTADLERRRTGERADWEACFESAKAERPLSRYSTYFGCMTDHVAIQDAPPLGRFKAPRDGVFVIVGDGASGRGCIEVRLYELGVGATYAAEDCGQGVTVSSGRVPLAALREAVWAILLAGEREHDVRLPLTFTVPVGIAIARAPNEAIGLSLRGFGTTSGRRIRHWSWMRLRGGALVGQASGALWTPDPASDMAQHAAELLAIADDGTTRGCAPAGIPRSPIRWDEPGPALEDGVSVELDGPETATVRTALSAIPRPPSCSTAP